VELKKKVESLFESGEITTEDSDNIISFCKMFEKGKVFKSKKRAPKVKAHQIEDQHLSELYSETHIEFEGRTFCFAGAMEVKREKAKALIESKAGEYSDSVHEDVDYLVVGKHANPRISQSTYGLKLESAMNLNIPVLSEDIFMSALKK
jgi:NAD-dependent DNA ligase